MFVLPDPASDSEAILRAVNTNRKLVILGATYPLGVKFTLLSAALFPRDVSLILVGADEKALSDLETRVADVPQWLREGLGDEAQLLEHELIIAQWKEARRVTLDAPALALDAPAKL